MSTVIGQHMTTVLQQVPEAGNPEASPCTKLNFVLSYVLGLRLPRTCETFYSVCVYRSTVLCYIIIMEHLFALKTQSLSSPMLLVSFQCSPM